MEELAELASIREFRKHIMPANERYALMKEEYPELTKRVPAQHDAGESDSSGATLCMAVVE